MREAKKERVFVVIDGSNFYHRLKEKPIHFENLLEFNFLDFIKWLVKNRKLVRACYYVGAIRTAKGNKKSFKLFRDQRKLLGILTKNKIDISLGYILKTKKYHEKGVDVQIAVDLLTGAYEDLWDTVILLSSDTDLLPAIQKVRQLGKSIEYFGFSHKPSFAMIRFATTSKLLDKEDLLPFISKGKKKK
jgi:uncharacterized LabA/DUF88 family protein